MTQRQLANTVSLTLHSFTDSTDDQDNPYKGKRSANIWIASPLEIYTGVFFQRCLHQVGTYKWYLEDGAYQYEGKIYANQIHGYGQLTYPDGSNYQGLFMNNKRFGPGVVTSADNTTQDVGIWQGPHLVRLNQIAIDEEKIPNIARTIKGKAHLLIYKNLVPVQEKYKDVAKDIVKELGVSHDLISVSDQLYSTSVRNPNSAFFNQKLYFETNFSKDTDMYIQIVEYKEYNEDNEYNVYNEPIYTQVLVEKLLAWNNDNLAIAVMKHAFLHRNYEKLLSFNVSDVLTSRRNLFLPPGEEETNCLNFLQYCQKSAFKLTDLITTKDVYINLTDSEGNNGVAYAVSRNQCGVINILADFGANLDNFNDECITPLMIGILTYISIKYDIHSEDWETFFLCNHTEKHHDQLESVSEWPEHFYESEVTSEESMFIKSQASAFIKYFFDLSFAETDTDLVAKKSNSENSVSHDQEFEEIIETLWCLLRNGANPNIGEVPFPPIITAIFSKCEHIVKFLLYYGANVFTKTSEQFGGLSLLHILATLPCTTESSDIAGVLLNHGANPNELCSNNHWLPQKEELLAGTMVQTDVGKTPLHLLCMRKNFADHNIDAMCDLAVKCLANNANSNLQYLGHTPLSLAVIRGNTSLVQNLLATGRVNPHVALGNNMGVALSVLTLVRYRNIIPLTVSQEIFHILETYYANPFMNVPRFNGNVVEFVFNENANRTRKNLKEKVPKLNSKTEVQSPIVKQFKSMAERVLLAYVHLQVCQIIFQYKFFYGIENKIFDILAKFIPTMKTVVYILQLLIDHEMITFTVDTCTEFLKYMSMFCKQENSKKKQTYTESDFINLIDFSNSKDWCETFFFKNILPEIDPDFNKYQVCFECLQKTNKHLMICPVCHLIYFCSENCNKLNNARKVNTHPCKVMFYGKTVDSVRSTFPMEIQGNANRFSQEKYKSSIDFFHNMFTEIIPNISRLTEAKPHLLRKDEVKLLPQHSESKHLKFDDQLHLSENRKKNVGGHLSNSDEAISGKKNKRESKNKSIYNNSTKDEEQDENRKSLKRNKRKESKKSKEEKNEDDKARSSKHDEDIGTKKRASKLKKSNKIENDDVDEKNKSKSRNRQQDSFDSDQDDRRDKSKSRRKQGEDRIKESGDDRKTKLRHDKDLSQENLEDSKKRKQRKQLDPAQKTKGLSSDKHTSLTKRERLSSKQKPLPGSSQDQSREKSHGTMKETTLRTNQRQANKISKDQGSRSRSVSRTASQLKAMQREMQNKLNEGLIFKRTGSKSTDRMASKGEEYLDGERLDRKTISKEFEDSLSNICENFDYKFWQMFMPYCICVDGQLYYKFNNEFYKKLTYSSV